MAALPWELVEEIAELACASFSGMLQMRGVCKRWKTIANKSHKRRVDSLHLRLLNAHYDNQPDDEVKRRLTLNSVYRAKKVKEWIRAERHQFILRKTKDELPSYLLGSFTVSSLSNNNCLVLSKYEYDIYVGNGAIYHVHKNGKFIHISNYTELFGSRENDIANFGKVYARIIRKSFKFVVN